MEPMTGIEPVTSSLPWKRCYRLSYIGNIYFLQKLYTNNKMAEETGFEPAISGVTGRRVQPLRYSSV